MAGKHVQTYLFEDVYLKFKMIAAVEGKTVEGLVKEAIASLIESRNGEVETLFMPNLKELLQESVDLLRAQLSRNSKL